MRARDWNKILAGLLVSTPIAQAAHAEIYLTADQAIHLLFPGVRMEAHPVTLDSEQMKAIRRASGEKPLSPTVRLWLGPNREAVFVDQVLGKHDYITYAVGITGEGKVKGVEIIEYKETYGYEVRDAAWRNRFIGKSAKDPLTLDRDIPNISGATLSSKHITDGVRRIVQTYELLKPGFSL